MKNKLQYYSIIFLSKILMLLPKKIRRGFFKLLGYTTYLLYNQNKKVIETNLKYVYNNNIDKKTIKSIQKSCYKKLFLTILSIIENEHLSKKEIRDMVTFENKEYFDSLKNPFIYITPHFGNIDLLGLTIGKLLGKMTQVQQKIKNPLLNEYMKRQREKYGLTIVERHGAVKKLFHSLKNGESISLIIDQNINPKYATKVKFLGKDSYQTSTSSQLSLKFNVPILPIFIVGEDDNYKVIFKKPIYPEGKTLEELNQLQADVMSDMIFKYPHEWFWCHKRFKNSNPSLYR